MPSEKSLLTNVEVQAGCRQAGHTFRVQQTFGRLLTLLADYTSLPQICCQLLLPRSGT